MIDVQKDKEALEEAGGSPEAILMSKTTLDKLKGFVREKARPEDFIKWGGRFTILYGMSVFTVTDEVAEREGFQNEYMIGTAYDIVKTKVLMEGSDRRVGD